MNKIFKSVSLIVILLSVAACAPAAVPTPVIPEPTVDFKPIYTAAVQTYEAEATRNAMLLPTATATLEPTATEVPPTATLMLAVSNATPTIEPTQWIPQSGGSYPSITASYDTNCRLGPSKLYEIVGGLRVGDTSRVFGQLKTGGWWYIENPTETEPKYCWVQTGTTVVSGDTDILPYITPPLEPSEAHPKLTFGIVALPPASVVCPSVLTVTATITSDRATTLEYQVVNNNGVAESGTLVFTDDGTQTITFTGTFNADTEGWVQLKILSPVTGHSTKAYYSVDCP
jgi:hypothetical protein